MATEASYPHKAADVTCKSSFTTAAQVLQSTHEEYVEVLGSLNDVVSSLKGSAEQGEADANTMQDSFGSASDPDASNLMQEAKIYADPCSRRQ